MSYEKNVDSIIDEIWENALKNMSDKDKELIFSEFTSNQLIVREVVKATILYVSNPVNFLTFFGVIIFIITSAFLMTFNKDN